MTSPDLFSLLQKKADDQISAGKANINTSLNHSVSKTNPFHKVQTYIKQFDSIYASKLACYPLTCSVSYIRDAPRGKGNLARTNQLPPKKKKIIN